MQPKANQSTVYRGRIIYPSRDPSGKVILIDYRDGGLVCNAQGKITAIGPWTQIKNTIDHYTLRHSVNSVILPGFVDSHLHFPQTDIIGSYGKDLLGWLKSYTFPEEIKFSDRSYSERVAVRFVDETYRAGTTSFAAFSSSHNESTTALFEECQRRGASATIGLVSMDRHAPTELLLRDIAGHERDLTDLKENWHGKDRLKLALTPRFAPSCSDDLLRLIGRMVASWPEIGIQTHFAESLAELRWVKDLYPSSKDYLSVYENFGLVTPQTILTHSIHVSDSEISRIQTSGAKIAHCPSSNLFLGSGVMPLERIESKANICLGTDVGAGTSFSMWHTMADCYKSHRLSGQSIEPAQLLWMATAAGADALGIGESTGTFEPGKFCDLQVIDPTTSPHLNAILSEKDMTADELVFRIIWHWQPDMTCMTSIGGKIVFDRQTSNHH